VKYLHQIIATAVLLCVVLVNAGILHAVHLHQYRCTNHPDEKQQSGSEHNPDKCPLCIQFTSIKTISADFTEHISFTIGTIEKLFLFRIAFLPSVSLSSQSPRSPPFISQLRLKH